jgi:hypothetical protein
MRKALGLIGLLENTRVRREVIRVALRGLGVCPHCLQRPLDVGHKTVRDAGELMAGVVTAPRLSRASHVCPQP